MIEKEKIEAIKNGVDLVALVESKGISLKKNGKSWFGLCPFHDDTDPSLSVNPTNNLWKCFGCGAGGDVIRFVEMFDHVDFKEAVNRLSVNSCQLPVKNKSRNRPNTKNKTTGLTAKLFKLLNRVIEFYHTAFCEDPRAKEYLINRGITDNAVFSDFKIGFANGTLLNTLPGDGDIFEQLKQIGVLTGKEKDINQKEYRFNRKKIREYSTWSDFQVRTHIRQLEELEYIYSMVGKRGKEYVYELVYKGGGEDGKPFLIGLTNIKQLKKKADKAGIIDDYDG